MLPPMPIPHARRMNLVALALLSTSLLSFVAFHFLVIEHHMDVSVMGKPHEMGWEIWPSLIRFLKDADFTELRGMIAASAFLCGVVLITVAPFLMPVLKRSRLAWWMLVLSSGIAALGFGGIVAVNAFDSGFSRSGPGVPCLLAAFALNFAGLLFVRRELPAEPPDDRA